MCIQRWLPVPREAFSSLGMCDLFARHDYALSNFVHLSRVCHAQSLQVISMSMQSSCLRSYPQVGHLRPRNQSFHSCRLIRVSLLLVASGSGVPSGRGGAAGGGSDAGTSGLMSSSRPNAASKARSLPCCLSFSSGPPSRPMPSCISRRIARTPASVLLCKTHGISASLGSLAFQPCAIIYFLDTSPNECQCVALQHSCSRRKPNLADELGAFQTNAIVHLPENRPNTRQCVALQDMWDLSQSW